MYRIGLAAVHDLFVEFLIKKESIRTEPSPGSEILARLNEGIAYSPTISSSRSSGLDPAGATIFHFTIGNMRGWHGNGSAKRLQKLFQANNGLAILRA